MRFFVTMVSCLLFSAPLSAEKKHAFSMHGAPKYEAGFRHTDYVNPDAPKGGRIKFAVIGTFDSLNPFVIKGNPPAGLSLLTEQLVFEGLMDRTSDEPFTVYGRVAEFIEVAPDRSWVIFTLNPKARWSDGNAMTADDVLFSFNLLKEQGRPNLRLFYKKVEKAEKIGDRGVKFTFKIDPELKDYNPEAPMLMALLRVLPKHALEGKDFEKLTLEPIPSSGPYKIKEYNLGKSIVYERREDYWGKDLPLNRGRYNFDLVQFEYYRDNTVAHEAFKRHEYDVRAPNDPKEWMHDFNFKAVKAGDVIKEDLPITGPVGMRAFVFNTRRDLFKDAKVREAINLAFDFEWMNKNLFHGTYKRTTSFFDNTELRHRGSPQGLERVYLNDLPEKHPKRMFEETFSVPSYLDRAQLREALSRAKVLLREAGWRIQGNTLIHAETGKPFRFEILLYNPKDEKLALALAKNLKPLGIQVTIRTVDPAQYERRHTNFDFDMTLWFWGHTRSPGLEQTYYWSSAAADQEGSRNYAGIKSKSVDALCHKIAHAKNRDELESACRALDRALLWGRYVIPLFHENQAHLAYWKGFGKPKYDPTVGIHFTSWWALKQNEGKES